MLESSPIPHVNGYDGLVSRPRRSVVMSTHLTCCAAPEDAPPPKYAAACTLVGTPEFFDEVEFCLLWNLSETFLNMLKER